MTESCIECGREIEGPVVEVPEGDTYHYACVDVEYPEPCMTEDVMKNFTPEGTGEETIRFFEYLRQNPYVSLDTDDPVDSLPEVYVRVKTPFTVDITLFGMHFSWVVYHRTEKINISPWLFQAVYFGCALEREFPAFADEDELYPRGEPRVPPEEEQSGLEEY